MIFVLVTPVVVWIQKWTVIASTIPPSPPHKSTPAKQRPAVVVVTSDVVVLTPVVWIQKWTVITSTVPPSPSPPPPPPAVNSGQAAGSGGCCYF